MKRTFGKIRGVGYIFWHARHMFYHLLLGALWMWVIQDQMGIYTRTLLSLSLFGSIFPDVEHLLFFLTFGKKDEYTTWVKSYVKHGDWRVLIRFIEKGHKYNTKLRFHNIYFVLLLVILTVGFFKLHVFSGFIFTGSMVIHYLFDIIDDLASLGKVNKNWYRWRKPAKKINPAIWKDLDNTINR